VKQKRPHQQNLAELGLAEHLFLGLACVLDLLSAQSCAFVRAGQHA
jgi:hypothetical protein